ncbi:RagB/SusD family nutrient uptake outer membrane protein [Chitinophaga oryziterrae]|uniref:RagB/SusD family nutrient uptake outer membrane protein n=1 Tax=Chitinophaga oryziterrae TaxID=1031224 RepID=A0A6N8J7R1_9BACT|nr:RagB/SusD family nutrient uptake outer membrane protein [Chitinophaga oryziterrae]MVT40306.1 RagB/SusD family nutrient uptake outer membrane protein [Chitinophaga oryziterrae]
MKNVIALLTCLLSLSSCSKFLEEYTTDQKYASTTADLESLMIGEAFFPNVQLSIYSQATLSDLSSDQAVFAPWLHVMDDDSETFLADYVETSQATPLYKLSGFHNWSQAPAIDILNATWEETAWRKLYKRIGALNAILFQAAKLAATTAPDEQLKHIRGEAYFLRGYYYFMLQNIYGSPYRKSTAATDEGVPVKISEKIDDQYFTRDNNEKVYNQIIADLNEAATYLQDYNPDNRIRVGIATVKALQSRVYLYTEQYDKVVEVLKDFESMGYSLTDLNQYVAGTSFSYRGSSEAIFTMSSYVIPGVFMNDSLSAWSGNDNRASAFKASDDLMSTYDTADLRRDAFFIRATKSKAWLPAKYRDYNKYNDPAQVSCIFYIRYAEVVLNRAEALAMMGSDGEARVELENLRMKRFRNASADQIPSSNEALVDFIRAERRRELCFEGQRWFDLRRYTVNSKYPLPSTFTIRHPAYSYDAQSNTHTQVGNYILKSITEDGPAWQVPIPDYAIEFNRGSLKNPIRSVRQIQPL